MRIRFLTLILVSFLLSIKPAYAYTNQAIIWAMFEVAPVFWSVIATVFAFLIAVILFLLFRLYKHKKRLASLRFDRDRYAEVLASARDGYYAWIYEPYKDVREKCSRRLALLLGLYLGTKSSFDDFLNCFAKEDQAEISDKIKKLRENGKKFEESYMLPSRERYVKLMGSIITNELGDTVCDVVWVRDTTEQEEHIAELSFELNFTRKRAIIMEKALDVCPYPAWVRDKDLTIIYCNDLYAKAVEAPNVEAVITEGKELAEGSAAKEMRSLASLARATKGSKSERKHIVIGGARRYLEISETPFDVPVFDSGKLDRETYTIGTSVDITEVEDGERKLKLHFDANARVLEALGCGVAVFDKMTNLAFYNKPYLELWGISQAFASTSPSYSMVLDDLRDRRKLPEVPDFRAYKKAETDAFGSIIDNKEDFIHLPDGKTFKRSRIAHPLGGLLITYEDITDRLALETSYNTLSAVQKETVDNLQEAISVFLNGRLELFNPAFCKMWDIEPSKLAEKPSVEELVDLVHKFFSDVDDWALFKKQLVKYFTGQVKENIRLHRQDGMVIDPKSVLLPDGGILISYANVTADINHKN